MAGAGGIMTVTVVSGMTMTETEDRMREDKPCVSSHLVKPYEQMEAHGESPACARCGFVKLS